MKIAILIPTIKPGGAEKQAALLAATLSEENEVHFVSLWDLVFKRTAVDGLRCFR